LIAAAVDDGNEEMSDLRSSGEERGQFLQKMEKRAVKCRNTIFKSRYNCH
jgi:hypothetical protein